ncbi:hypothetical protein J3R30DRAFT_3657686 [Lentinula aciculospora]|uniref:Carbohydrate kinase PfkB domain-containing protein n=1 Tax=Lentinula aciculospora TaxID=153920 RepID=A0A9W9A9T2_9AGAR|nr:hypothetical protein J3R30DRAFT_3657686 [Lentinula aciculospora]
MAKLRKESREVPSSSSRPLRILASGTLFLTHTLAVPHHPAPSTVIRASSVTTIRGGSASSILALLAQFTSPVDPILVASLGGSDEGRMLMKELEREGVNTRYCKIWPDAGVPSAWVIQATENDTRTVINHNPLPDITHEEFVSLLGPLLVPENYYMYSIPSASPTLNSAPGNNNPTPSPSTMQQSQNPNTPAPFDWIHFEGRSVKTTLNNITGLDSLARERKWRSHCVFSVDVGRRNRQGIEALIPHADVLFLNKHYAQMHYPNYATTPRAFLLSLMSIAPPHALLIAHWGSEGAAALSLPTKEYFQSSGWVEERPLPRAARATRRGRPQGTNHLNPDTSLTSDDVRSVRTGSDFWAGARSNSPSSSAFTARDHSNHNHNASLTVSESTPNLKSRSRSRGGRGVMSHEHDSYEHDSSQGTEILEEEEEDIDDGVVDEVGAQDAFVSGMIYALSRRLLPGPPFTPYSSHASRGEPDIPSVSLGENDFNDKSRWKLDECLRFATELAGRKARRRTWAGLADEMGRAEWFDG